jgi:ubiquinone/menaquinone biosynthesis C-methylase UbiE
MGMKPAVVSSVGDIAAELVRESKLSRVLLEDLQAGLQPLVRDRRGRDLLAQSLIEALRNPRDGIFLARQLVAPYRAKFWEQFQARGLVVFERIRAEVEESRAQVPRGEPLACFDWGTGKGRYPEMLRRSVPGCEAIGGDILDYRDAKDVPFLLIRNNKVPQLQDESQHVVLLSFVLHHERYPEKIINELGRIVASAGRVVVLENSPSGDKAAERELGRKRLLFADLLHTVVWQDVDMPMPGTYKQTVEWKAEFEQAGFELIKSEAFEGTPLLRGNRQFMVFEKGGGGLSSLRMPHAGGWR